MSTDAAIERSEDGRVSILSMVHRPHNLLGPKLLEALLKMLDRSRKAGSTAIILKSGLRHFSAGAEIEMFDSVIAKCGQGELPVDLSGFLKEFEAFPLPIVASVHGICVGGGFELALVCDYIVAAASAKMGCVEATLGINPLMGAIQRVTQRAGVMRAKEMSLLGRRYDPATLERWGLINLVVPEDALESTTLTIAKELAHGPTVAHTATKKLALIAVNQGVAAADEAMSEAQRTMFASEDFKTGVAAFRANGPGTAVFEGR